MNDNSTNNKSEVALVRCNSYDETAVYEAVRAGLELIGGTGNFFRTQEKIAVKPNVLIGSGPEKCVCTHPSVFRAVVRLLMEAGVSVTYGDSPAFGGCKTNMKRAGLSQIADELGIEMADFDEGKVQLNSEALINQRFVIANGVLDADGLVSLPKLKSHEFTTYTGAIKNQYGCIPGVLKSLQHARFADVRDFAAMLVDLNMIIKPRLCIMDAIMAMEGNGPRSGNPRQLGVLLFSSDAVALDAVACRIINLDTALVPTFEPGEKAGLGTYHVENIELLGENIEGLVCKDFDVVRKRRLPTPAAEQGKGLKSRIRGWLSSLVRKTICQRPVIDKGKCTSCGTCVRSCPVKPKAVDWRRGNESRPPIHDYNLCIRCYCCQEYCPEGAISVREPLIGRAMSRIFEIIG